MGVTLIEQTIKYSDVDEEIYVTEDTGRRLPMTMWVWRPIVQYLIDEDVVRPSKAERMLDGSGIVLSKGKCTSIATCLYDAIERHGALVANGPLVVSTVDGKIYEREVADRKEIRYVSPYVANAQHIRDVADFMTVAAGGVLVV